MAKGKDLNVVYKPVADLIPYARNARTHSDEQIAQVAASIKEFGFTNPILIDGENGIIAGHGRLMAARKLGLEKVPTIELSHLSPTQKRAYILADNRLALNAGWDDTMLALELGELKELDYDLSLTGFDDGELSTIFDKQDVGGGLTDEDEVPEVEEDEPPVTKRGDVWICGNHRLVCGDSTEAEDVALGMGGGALADFVFTDPPWNVNYGADEQHPYYKPRKILNDCMPTDEFKKFMEHAFGNMSKNVNPGAPIYVVMSAQEWGNLMIALAENDFHWSSTIIWNKDAFVLSRKDYHTKYEPIWYGWDGRGARLCPLEDRNQSDVWDIPRPKRSDEHPTMKPVELVERAILNSSKSKSIVLDLFGGSGTTMIAAEKTNRCARLVELDEHYCDVIVKRWQDFSGKEAYRESDGMKFNDITN